MIVPLEYERVQDTRKANHKDREYQRGIQRDRSERIKNEISKRRSERKQNLRLDRNVRAEEKRKAEEAERKRLADLENTDWTKHKETAFARREEDMELVLTREQKMKNAFDLKSALLEFGGDENSNVRTIRKTRKRKKNEGRYTGQTRALTGKWNFKEYNNETIAREMYSLYRHPEREIDPETYSSNHRNVESLSCHIATHKHGCLITTPVTGTHFKMVVSQVISLHQFLLKQHWEMFGVR